MGSRYTRIRVQIAIERENVFNTPTWAEVVTLGLTVLGFGAIGYQLWQNRRQEKLQLGHLYLERYWKIDDELLEAEKGSDEHRRSRHKYLILTEDEIEAARLDWLDASQWSAWHSFLASPQGQEAIERDLDAVGPPAGRFSLLKACLGSPPAHAWDACKAHSGWGAWAGLGRRLSSAWQLGSTRRQARASDSDTYVASTSGAESA